MPTPNRRPHPSVSDVAMALATRQRSERSCTAHVERVAKGEMRFSFDLTDPDPEYVLKTTLASIAVLRAEYPSLPPEPVAAPPTAEEEKEKAANQALRGRIAAAKGRAK